VNHYKIQTWLEDRYAGSAGKEEYKKAAAQFPRQECKCCARVMESEMVERLAAASRTPTPARLRLHAELLGAADPADEDRR